MAAGEGIGKNSDLRKAVLKGMNKWIKRYLLTGFVCVVATLFVDIFKEVIYAGVFRKEDSSIYIAVRELKQNLLRNFDQYCNLVTTLDTILAAAVIFFYSIQDSRRGGIPHRTILAYTLGSFTIPVLFVVTLIMLPWYYIAHSFGWNRTACVSLLFTYIIQMMIVVFILAATSFQYSVYAITNVEIRQFKALNALGEKDRGEEGRYSGCPGAKVEQNPFFSWTYLQHHMEQVTTSDELAVDKLLIIRRILRVPYYRREIRLRDELLESGFGRKVFGKILPHEKIEMSAEKLASNDIERLYEFYYGNLMVVFTHLNQPDDAEYRDKMYLVLYEFLEELSGLYDGVLAAGNGAGKGIRNYAMTISGIINAVMASNMEKAEGFCYYVLNNVVNKDIWNIQISLYILFQEYLYRTNTNYAGMGKIEGIRNIRMWKNDLPQIPGLYGSFWIIWMKYTTVTSDFARRCYFEAVRAFSGKGNTASPVAYSIHMIRRKVDTYDNKSDSDAQ